MTRQKLLKLRKYLTSLALLAVVFVAGYYSGQKNLIGQKGSVLDLSLNSKNSGITIDRFVSVPQNVDFNLFWEVWDKLKTQYIDHEKLDESKMVYQAIKGLVNATDDPYTVFLTPDENKRAKDDLSGAFEGIGIQLGYKEYMGENRLTVISALEGNPAIIGGIKDGDLILKIDGESTQGMSLPDAVDRIRGKKGTTVTLALFTQGDEQSHDITITRGTINVPSVELKWLPAVNGQLSATTPANQPATDNQQPATNIAHLRVSRFGEQTTTEWNKKVREILQHNPSARGIILDLRGNPGGFFQGAIELGSDLVTSGVIVQQQSSTGEREQFRANGSARLVKIPLVIIVNQGSASASEILAGAVRELRGVKLVGEKTFGKGSVQEAIDLQNNTGLHITTYRWLLPSGKSIDKDGIAVDIEVENDPETPEADEQLQKAIEQLNN